MLDLPATLNVSSVMLLTHLMGLKNVNVMMGSWAQIAAMYALQALLMDVMDMALAGRMMDPVNVNTTR